MMTLRLCSLLSLFVTSVWSLQCMDPSNNFVDWYAGYKAPRLPDGHTMLKEGLAHYYLDVNSPSWTLSQNSLNDSGTSIYNTLGQIYSLQKMDANTTLYIMYNDEHPSGLKTYTGGHTKGVLAFDGKSGFWLIHSVPKFPPRQKDGFAYPHTGTKYGQSFLCVSLPLNMLGVVGKQLLYNEPHIYDHNAPQSFLSKFPVLSQVLNRDRPRDPPFYNVADITSTRGQKFTTFAKTTAFGRDLYAELVAPRLKTSLLVETWMDGAGELATNCTFSYKVYSVKDISLPQGVLFKRSKDHSKWATAFKASQSSLSANGGHWTCVGDINRMYTQFKRGGGTVCLDNASVWKAFHQSVVKFERCNRTAIA